MLVVGKYLREATMIRERAGKFRLYTKDGARPLGPWTTKEEAEAQERAVQANKHGSGRSMQRWGRRHAKKERRKVGSARDDAAVVETIRREAKERGSTLARDGEGGLDPRLALKVFRRDDYKCQVPNCETPREKADLDHIGGHAHELEQDPEAKAWLKREAAKGKENTEDGLHVLCARHHDMVHQRERAIESGKQPPPMSR